MMISYTLSTPSEFTTSNRSKRYIFIAGHGRSGTKWIMNLFDSSPQTFCRNEPDEIAETRLSIFFADRSIWRQNTSLFDEKWDEIIYFVLTHIGERDLKINIPKEYLYEIPWRLGVMRLLFGSHFRSIMQKMMPTLRGSEWPIPWWIGDFNKLKDAIGVIKTVQTPGWAVFVLQYRPEVPVVHIVRHPGGYINSWLKRYVSNTNPVDVAELNQRRLYDISDTDPEWKRRFGNIASMSMVESELWYWLYATETIHHYGNRSHNYHLIIFEDLAQNAPPIMKKIYESAGLPWSEEVQSKIKSDCGKSLRIANNWKNNLSIENQELVSTILQDSPLNKFWEF